jgi:hypothetical protein
MSPPNGKHKKNTRSKQTKIPNDQKFKKPMK